MHMARLLDPTRGPKSYSLANLTEYYNRSVHSFKQQLVDKVLSDPSTNPEQAAMLTQFKQRLETRTKINMTKIFSRRRKLKNGELGKTVEMPSIVELHTSPETIQKWVEYATLDAEATFFLREYLVVELRKFKVQFEDMRNLFDLYCKYWLPFGEVLTELERSGIKVDLEHLAQAEKRAFEDLHVLEKNFLDWVRSIQPEADQFNPSSVAQLQQLLYAPFKRSKAPSKAPKAEPDVSIKDFEKNLEELRLKEERAAAAEENDDIEEDEELPKTVKKPSKISLLTDFPEVREFKVENLSVVAYHQGEPQGGKAKPLKYKTMNIRGLGIKPKFLSDSGLPSVDIQALSDLAGDPAKEKFGYAFEHFEYASLTAASSATLSSASRCASG